MTEQRDISEFIEACLAMTERAALAWPDNRRHWVYDGEGFVWLHTHIDHMRVHQIDPYGHRRFEPGWRPRILVESGTEAQTDHLLNHAPDQVLRDIAAKRRILERHTPDLLLHHPDTPQACPVCCYDNADDEMYPCPDLRDLAAIWADHPAYCQAWAL